MRERGKGSGEARRLTLASSAGRWTIAAAVLGSGAVFVESTVVNVALPSIARDFGLGMEGVQWVVNAYLLTLGALLLLGGSLGDVFGRRRVFAGGLLGFAATTALCAVAPSFGLLIGARLLQGAAGALLVPNSLALLDTAFVEEQRGEAIGKWAAWSAVSTAGGPLLGGALIDYASWRWVFASVAPIAVAAAWIAWRLIPEVQQRDGTTGVDLAGALLVTGGLGATVWMLIAGPELGFASPAILAAGIGGVALLVAFVLFEKRARAPLLPLGMFSSRQFSGANVTTLLIYAALGSLFLFLMLQLQNVLGYGALAAGAALLPINALMLLLSARAGRWATRVGPRTPIAGGAVAAAAGMMLFARVDAGSSYWTTVLPAVLLFGTGLGVLVAPLTSAVLAAADEGRAGVASAVNNAAARLAGLFATAMVPLAAGIGGLDVLSGPTFAAGYTRAMWISAGLCLTGGAVAWTTIRKVAKVEHVTHPTLDHGCPHHRQEAGIGVLRQGSRRR
ncbi:MAG: MFS transporter [Longimicrobiales bacterium]